jgi:hypothetical protein
MPVCRYVKIHEVSAYCGFRIRRAEEWRSSLWPLALRVQPVVRVHQRLPDSSTCELQRLCHMVLHFSGFLRTRAAAVQEGQAQLRQQRGRGWQLEAIACSSLVRVR